jgi:hypothetical protein
MRTRAEALKRRSAEALKMSAEALRKRRADALKMSAEALRKWKAEVLKMSACRDTEKKECRGIEVLKISPDLLLLLSTLIRQQFLFSSLFSLLLFLPHLLLQQADG